MKQRGFTLLEILIVIAILAVLASVLLPVFTRAKRASKTTVCLSNLRQLGNSHALYGGDWDDAFAYGASPWGQTMALKNADFGTPYHVQCLGQNLKTLLRPYGADDHLWQCPDDGIEASIRQSWRNDTYYEATGGSYWSDQLAAYEGLSFTSIEKPSEYSLMMDVGAFHGGDKEFGAQGRIGNALFYDLHVKSLPEGRLIETERPEIIR